METTLSNKLSETVPGPSAARVYKRILVGTDFSAASAPAIEQGLKLAGQNRAELLIVHCSPLPGSLSFMPSDAYDHWVADHLATARQHVSGYLQTARDHGIRAHLLELTGFADQAIVQAAKRLGVDLIIVASHGRRAVSRFFWGGNCARVMAHAPCAVLTVRN